MTIIMLDMVIQIEPTSSSQPASSYLGEEESTQAELYLYEIQLLLWPKR